jgi:hypothetical protein
MITAATYAGSTAYYVFAFSGPRSTAVSMEKNADFVSMPISIQSNQREPAARFAEIRQAQDLLLAKAKEQSDIVIHKGAISLSPQPASRMSSISPYSYTPPSTAQLYILARMDGNIDAYASAARIRRFVDSITMPGRSEYSLGQIQLTIANPEQYRQKLLEMILEDVSLVQKTMRALGSVSITGLENPVLVRQVDDQRVELFINYSMTIELSNNRLKSVFSESTKNLEKVD